jgi:hypothetical protein
VKINFKKGYTLKMVDFSKYEHGTMFMKFTFNNDKYDDVETNGEKYHKVILHGLITDDGDVIITDEIIKAAD